MIYHFFNSLPLSIQKIPYFIGLMLVKFIYLDCPIKIWPRNSYELGTLICTLSDLDLTFYASSPCDMNRHIWRYKLLKLILPFLGEINFYQAQELTKFIKYANTFELDRDPTLSKLIGKNTGIKNDFEKLVFFLKVIESDRTNLAKIPNLRQKKWLFHFEHLGWEFPNELTLPLLIAQLKNKLSEKGINSGGFLDAFFSIPSKSKEDLNAIYEKFSSEKLIKEYILLYPFYWIGSAFYHQNFDHDLEFLSDLSQDEGHLLLEQVRWELWGLFTQLEVTKEKGTLLVHLEYIKRLILKVKHSQLNEETLEAIDTLSELVEANLENYKV